jgi:hypothetical protein
MRVNSALGTSAGGAVLNAGTMTITNGTASRELVDRRRRGIFSAAGSALIIDNVTIASNASSGGSGGGGISVDPAASATLSNSILANNQASGPADDCLGAITSLGGNLVEVTSSCTGLGPDDITSLDPMLGPLQDNGGRTFTHAAAGQPRDRCWRRRRCELIDQRGLSRPQGADCDIGAFEFFPNCPAVTLSPTTLPEGDPGVFYTSSDHRFGRDRALYVLHYRRIAAPGLALNSTTGVIRACPPRWGLHVHGGGLRREFLPGTRSYTIVIGVPCDNTVITLSPASLPAGTQTQNYSQQIIATGGTAPYQYDHQRIPSAGRDVERVPGVISGTPTASEPTSSW